jgi:hypothetical protein
MVTARKPSPAVLVVLLGIATPVLAGLAGNCVDSKGGISQVCCAASTTTPCFPTAAGGSIQRTGKADPPAPVWPDPTYPKNSSGGLFVATFCEPATGVGTVDVTTGLPGPGAMILPVAATCRGNQ